MTTGIDVIQIDVCPDGHSSLRAYGALGYKLVSERIIEICEEAILQLKLHQGMEKILNDKEDGINEKSMQDYAENFIKGLLHDAKKSAGLIKDDLIPEKRTDRLNDTELRTLFKKAFDCGYNVGCEQFLSDEWEVARVQEEIRDNGLVAFFKMYEDFLNAHEKGYELNGYMSVEVDDKGEKK